MKMKEVKNTNYYAYDQKNIAKSLMKAMNQNADPGVVDYLNSARKQKVENGGDELKIYENDGLSRAADDYVKSYEKTNVSKLHQARRDQQSEALKKAHQAARDSYESAVEQTEKDYSEARRLYLADEHKKRLDTEDSLAKMGLGRGVSAEASSGFGESARVKALSDAAEGLKKLYKDEQAEKKDHYLDMQTAMSQASDKYMENIDSSYKDQATDILEADKNYQDNRTKLMDINNNRQESDRDFNYNKDKEERDQRAQASSQTFDTAFKTFEATGEITTESQAAVLGLPVGTTTLDAQRLAYDIAYSEREFASDKEKQIFNQAFSAFEAAGTVTSQEMADILGIPVGTEYWRYVNDSMRARANVISANASASNAASNAAYRASQAAVNAQNANTNSYKSQTDRMLAENKIENDRVDRETKQKKSSYGYFDDDEV